MPLFLYMAAGFAVLAAIVFRLELMQWRPNMLISVDWTGKVGLYSVHGVTLEFKRRVNFFKKQVEQRHVVVASYALEDMRFRDTKLRVPYWLESQVDRAVNTRNIRFLTESETKQRLLGRDYDNRRG